MFITETVTGYIILLIFAPKKAAQLEEKFPFLKKGKEKVISVLSKAKNRIVSIWRRVWRLSQ